MKHAKINYSILLLFTLSIGVGCKDEEQKIESSYCDYLTGDSVTNQIGRVYKWTDQATSKYFYYIGNPDTQLKGSGFVPCNQIADDFKSESNEGVLVIYSGKIKSSSDAEEPMFFGIELTEIRKGD